MFFEHYLQEVLISSDVDINRLANIATFKINNIEKIVKSLTNQVNFLYIYVNNENKS